MCGIAGIIYRGRRARPIGHDMTRMLQSMKHRGPGLDRLRAVRAARRTTIVMRYKLADANDPRDFDFLERLERHQRRGRGAARPRSARRSIEVEAETEYAYRVELTLRRAT